MSTTKSSEIPLPAQATIGAFEGGDTCEFAADMRGPLDQKFRSLGAAAPSPVILNFKAFNRNTLKGVFDLELPSGLVICGAMLRQVSTETLGLPCPASPTRAGRIAGME